MKLSARYAAQLQRQVTALFRGLVLRFKITDHSGHSAPSDAVDQLWAHWPAQTADVQASRRGPDIHIIYGHHEVAAAHRPEQVERERVEVLDLVLEICEKHRGLRLDWYAVAPLE
jgi:hypothetical protein